MKTESCPILEFDPDREAILNPNRSKQQVNLPKRAVLCFFQEVLSDLAGRGKACAGIEFDVRDREKSHLCFGV